MLEYLVAGLTALVVIATVVPFSRSEVWWIRGLGFPAIAGGAACGRAGLGHARQRQLVRRAWARVAGG